MIYLIDGYNLVYASRRGGNLMDAGRVEEARDLVVDAGISYGAAHGKSRFVFVFDGKGGRTRRPRPRRRREGGNVEVLFTGGISADDLIVEKARSIPRAADVTVVTSDRHLAARIRELGIRVEGSDRFWEKVTGSLRRGQPGEKTGSPFISYDEYMEMLRTHEAERGENGKG